MKTLIALTLLALTLRASPPQADTQANPPFAIVISAEEREVKYGARAMVKVELTNNSDHDLDMSTGINDFTAVDPNYVVDVRDSKGNSAPKRVYKHPEFATTSVRFGGVEPGKTYTSHELVGRLYDMSAPGDYVVQVSRRVSDNESDGFVKSNAITITVLPPPTLSWTDANAYPPFEIVISAGEEFKAGSDVSIHVVLTNHSTHNLDMTAVVNSLGLRDPVTFEALDSSDHPAPLKHFTSEEAVKYYATHSAMSSNIGRTVEPGETFTEDQIISQWIDLTSPGEYVVQASRRLSEGAPEPVVRSNQIIIRVTAPK